MKTQYFTTEDDELRRAGAILKAGGLVAFPTETVYGLGGDALNPEASQKIYAAKGRPSDNPLIVHIYDFEQIKDLASFIPESAKKLACACWPGPLTMVFNKQPCVPDTTTGGLNTVAIRLPQSEAARKLIKYSGTVIAAPSANLSGCPSPTAWQHVQKDMDGRIDGIIMGEPCEGGIESTVLDLTDEHPSILRPGLITPEIIGAVLDMDIPYDPAILASPGENLVPKAPGMKYKHYAPKADMILFEGKSEAVKEAIEKTAANKRAEGLRVATLIYAESDLKLAAREFFAQLRKTDEECVDLILASALPMNDSLGFSVMNRMLKAAGYHIEEV